MNTSQDLSIISLVLNASVLAQAVMGLLLLLSLMSWTFIFRKWFAIRRARAQTERFEKDFWSGGDLQALYQSAANNRHTIGALERIFEAGMREFLKAKEKRLSDPGLVLDGARRAMRAAFQREMDVLEANLAFLASVGSVSPYIGLFGTVWGIMNSFRGLANVQQATRRDSGRGRVQPLRARHRPPRDPLRDLHRRILEHPAASGPVRSSPWQEVPFDPACAAAARAARWPTSTSCRIST